MVRLPDFDLADGIRRLERALELDANDPEANRIMANVWLWRGAYDEARQSCEKAMALSPSDANIWINAADVYNRMCEHEHALQLLDEADVLDPFVHTDSAVIRINALYCLGRFDEAIAAALRVPFPTADSRLYRAVVHAALGQHAQARAIIAEALASHPDLTSASIKKYRDPKTRQTLLELLVGAGLPEESPTAVAA